MAIRRRDFLKLTGAAAFAPALSLTARADSAGVYDLERFGNARILHMTDTHAQLRPVYFREPSVNLGTGAMQGQPPHLVGRAFLDRFGIKPDSADAYAFTLPRLRKIRRPLRQTWRLCASQDPDRQIARRGRRRARAAARRRRFVAGHRTGQCHPGRRHGRCREPAGHRGDDRPLGIHLWRDGAAQQSGALQGRIPGAECLPHRGGRVQRRQGVRCRLGTRVQAGCRQGTRQLSRGGDRAGLSLCADRASEAVHAELDLRHPRWRIAETGRWLARQRQGRCRGAAVA